MSKTDGKELKEKLFTNKKNGWENLSDEELKNKTNEFKERLENGETLIAVTSQNLVEGIRKRLQM